MDNKTTELLFQFVALILVAKLIDPVLWFLQEVLKRIPHLPNVIERPFAYLLSGLLAYFICWSNNFAFFKILGFDAKWEIEGFILTALLISGGSKSLRNTTGELDYLPSFLSSIISSTRRLIVGTAAVGQQNEEVIKEETATVKPKLEGRSSL